MEIPGKIMFRLLYREMQQETIMPWERDDMLVFLQQ